MIYGGFFMIEKEKRLDLMDHFDKRESLYQDFLKYFYNTITGILAEQSIVVQSVDTRLKKRNSLKEKIDLKKKYKSLEEITDVCGMRIITYFSDDVDKIADIINEEFEVDIENSVDKRKFDDPTKFGYVSLHYIVSLKGERSELREAKRFKNLKIEIQIRTILQHAWAEIEHDLGYKTVGDIPDDIRRTFSLLAGHIELADERFVMIKNDMRDYSEKSEDRVKNNDSSIPIDIVTMNAFVNNDEEYLQSIDLLSRKINARINQEKSENEMKKYLSYIIDMCNILKIETISQLKEVYMEYSDAVITVFEETGVAGFTKSSPLSEVVSTLSKAEDIHMSQKDFISQSILEFENEIIAQQEEYDSYLSENGTLDWDE